ncbi:hypothetical protein SAMN02910298_01072 [Pseudobutyrivibrio sp. YE44]|uniref:hypothetical protein n=1 Tax=Pseudobutyrivibrio sp. YE44 TaxID=1520802 RepID=UPI00087EA553|nr:hypothetical protein [Pseudobutyrivibrio sp. YE44]SDB22283.1 hypothetical protein SAMN02910298_01072 [Pseudobutyrivibrio sp. YE44]
MKKTLVLALICSMLAMTACGNKFEDLTNPETATETITQKSGATTQSEGKNVSNKIFTVNIPDEFADQYIAEIQDDQVTFYYKELKESIDRGLLFYVRTIELPNAEIGGMSRKIGEVTTADGKGYAVSLGYPSEAQWDIENEAEAPEGYDKFYNVIENIVKNITGVDGGTFTYQAGCKGEDLYGDILDKYKTAAKEDWDASKYEENDMSPEIFSIVKNSGLDKVGYDYVDIDLNGIDELVVGDMSDSEISGAIYDIYTMVNGQPAHVVSGSARDCYYVYHTFVVNEASGGALESVQSVYSLEPNTTEMMLQWATKYDGYENEKQPWFIGYSDEEWENVSEEDYNTRMADPADYTKLEFKSMK